MRPHESVESEWGAHCTALVTGGTGAVGPSLVAALLRAGHRVRMLVRGDVERYSLPEGVTVVRGDLNDRRAMNEATRGVGLVFHLAAKLHVNNPPPSLREEFQRVNVEGTRCVAETAAKHGVRRFIHFSTINVYGTSEFPNVFDESSPVNCRSWYAETKHESEQIALGTLPTTVLRLAAIYGPRMKGNYARLFSTLRSRHFVPIGSGRNRRTLLHQEDIAEAALLAALHPESAGQVFNVSDGELHTLNEIIAAMCHALGRRVPTLSCPVGPAKVCASLVDAGLRCLGRRPFARAAVATITEDVAVDASRIRSRLGYIANYDLHRGWRTMTSSCPGLDRTVQGRTRVAT